MSAESDVIDLTDSFTLIDHYQIADMIIDLDDTIQSSPIQSRRNSRTSNIKTNSAETVRPAQRKTQNPSTADTSAHQKVSKGRSFGDCPICWDELGKNRLASTKCGHVFCLHCIQQVVLQTKRCPTCRCVLKGSSAYHPLYLP